MLDDHGFRTDCHLLAGFNEDCVKRGVGHLQEIYVEVARTPGDFLPSDEFIRDMGKVLSPFPGFILCGQYRYPTPVFDANGTPQEQAEVTLSRIQRYTKGSMIHYTTSNVDLLAISSSEADNQNPISSSNNSDDTSGGGTSDSPNNSNSSNPQRVSPPPTAMAGDRPPLPLVVDGACQERDRSASNRGEKPNDPLPGPPSGQDINPRAFFEIRSRIPLESKTPVPSYQEVEMAGVFGTRVS